MVIPVHPGKDIKPGLTEMWKPAKKLKRKRRIVEKKPIKRLDISRIIAKRGAENVFLYESCILGA